jgi:hypothetical protein
MTGFKKCLHDTATTVVPAPANLREYNQTFAIRFRNTRGGSNFTITFLLPRVGSIRKDSRVVGDSGVFRAGRNGQGRKQQRRSRSENGTS